MTGSDRDRRAGTDGPDAAAERRRTVAAAFAVVVLVASVLPIPAAPSGGCGGGTVGGVGRAVVDAFPAAIGVTGPFHFLGYAVLAALLVRAIGRERRVVAVAMAVTAATAVGFGIELVQAPIPWRSFAWSDAAVNAVGAVLGASVSALRRRRSGERTAA
ncbi:MAG: VanZ family protein [Halorubrum sp.]|uniref:VanZ family protein n=1 Tax=Halorubrum sp. TaxID=1879286 RepID=UPI0039706D2E